MQDIQVYLSGKRLYGDDFDAKHIEEWFADEAEGYANLGAKDRSAYRYVYHALNARHAFRHLPKGQRFSHVLGMGAAYGDEFLPIADRIDRLTVVDPSDAFVTDIIHGVPARYIKPHASGFLPVQDDSVDLITCFGVLHHIPNVSFVVRDLARVLRQGGYIVIREPNFSMGDWRQPRKGLTKRERGIPAQLMRDILGKAGLRIVYEALCVFPVLPRVFGGGVYNSRAMTALDALLCAALAWNVRYHPRGIIQKFRPTALSIVAVKRH